MDRATFAPLNQSAIVHTSAYIDESPLTHRKWNRQHEGTVVWTFDDPTIGTLYQAASQDTEPFSVARFLVGCRRDVYRVRIQDVDFECMTSEEMFEFHGALGRMETK